MQTAPIKPMQPWFRTLDELSVPFEWSSLFEHDAPIELDIGCGRGLFLFSAATQNSGTNYLGLEADYREGRRAAERLLKRELPNARVIGGDARIMLGRLIPPHTVTAAHVYFPDPWWKTRHHKRRIFSPEFLQMLSRILVPGGALHSWTDVADYFELVVGLMSEHPDFVPGPTPEERPAEHDMDYQTSFERKKRRLGVPIYRGLWFRRALSESASETPGAVV